jgi:glycerol-3-phosphate dehydrogenase
MSIRFPQNPDAVVLGGSFGWALTKVLAARNTGWTILFLMRDSAKVEEARRTRLVDKFFGEKTRLSGRPGLSKLFELPDNVLFFPLSDFRDRFRGSVRKLFVPAVSSNSLRAALDEIVSGGVPRAAFQNCETLSVSKGMENASLRLSHEVIDDALNVKSVVGLGGNLAFELAVGHPMLMELAGETRRTARVADFFRGTNFNIFRTRNRRKLDLAGPMKNVHSLATGMGSEIFGNSSAAAIATIGLAEYEHAAFLVQFPEKFRFLAKMLKRIPFNFRSVPIAGGAMSDYHLFRFTRNFDAGQRLARKFAEGEKIEEAIAAISKGKTIESFTSARPTRDFLKRVGAESSVIGTMARILQGKTTPEDGVNTILGLRIKT